MKYLLPVFLLLSLYACKNRTNSAELEARAMMVADSIAVADAMANAMYETADTAELALARKKEYMNELPDEFIDQKTTKKWEGSWKSISDNTTEFLNSYVKQGDSIVFSGAKGALQTSGGRIKFNRYVKIYMGTGIFNMYEYYVNKDGKLVLIQYNWASSYSDAPTQELCRHTIEWISDNKVRVTTSGKSTFVLERY